MGGIYGAGEKVLVCLSVEGSRSGGLGWLQRFALEFPEYEQTNERSHLPKYKYAENFFEQNFDDARFHRGWDALWLRYS